MKDINIQEYLRDAREAFTLPNDDGGIRRDQLRLAILSAGHAYCPYSKFHVGAAILIVGGGIYGGCNVENAAYGSTICAERNAISSMIAARGPDVKIKEVTVWCPTPTPVPPCGECRQVIREFAANVLTTKVWSYCLDPELVLGMTVQELLPNSFGPDNLG